MFATVNGVRVTTTPTRRERVRAATVHDIKDAARRMLVTGGPQAISLRAIARDMGMTAPAIYRYFPSLDALVMELADDLYDELRATIVAALDPEPADEPLRQLSAMARAFRRWSVAHPAEFGLLFGNPVPGLVAFESACPEEEHSGHRFGAAFLGVFAAVWHTAPFATPPRELISDRLVADLEPYRQAHGPDLPLEVTYLYLSGWTRLYGLVAMEVFGHMRWALADVESLFETELANFVYQLRPVD
jgi:AcrR family transcriptional regulator